MAKFSEQPDYGVVDTSKYFKDLVLIDKNTGTYGAPAYASGATRKMTMIDFMVNYGQLLPVKKTLSAAQIKTGNSVAIQVGHNFLGAGYVLEPVSAFAKLNFGTVAFDCVIGDLQLKFVAQDNILTTGQNFVNAGADKMVRLNPDILVQLPELVENTDVVAQISDDSTVGDSTIDIYVSFRMVKL